MKNVIIAVDFIEDNKILLDTSFKIIEKLNAKVWVIHIAAPDPVYVGYDTGTAFVSSYSGPKFDRKFRADKLREEHRTIQEIAGNLKKKGIDSEALLFPGPTAKTLVEYAEKLNADMIIIGFHKGGFLSAIFGDVTIDVLKKSRIPILSIPTY